MSISNDAWRPLHEAKPSRFVGLRRVLMAGYYRESGQTYPKVGEAEWCQPDGCGPDWYWADGSKVINPLSFQDFPDFPVSEENSRYAVGRPIPRHPKEPAE